MPSIPRIGIAHQELEPQRLEQTVPMYSGSTVLTGAGAGGSVSQTALLAEVFGWAGISQTAIANRFSSLEIEVYRDDKAEIEVLTDHPLEELFNDPNPVMDKQTLMWLWGYQFSQTADVYTQIIVDGRGTPIELWPLPSDMIAPRTHPTKIIDGYTVRTPGAQVELELDEVMRVYKPDPLTLFTALSPLMTIGIVQDTESYRAQSNAEGFKNDAVPRVAILSSNEATPPKGEEETEAVNATFRNRHHRRHGRDRGLPVWLPSGMTPYEFGNSSLAEANVALGESNRRWILSAYGTPESVLGMSQDASRNVAETNDYVFDDKTIKPITRFFESAFTMQIARQFDPRLKVRFKPFVTRDKSHELLQEQSDLATGTRIINEVRAGRDIGEAVDWGEEPRGNLSETPYTGQPQTFGAGFESPADLGTSAASGVDAVPQGTGVTSTEAAAGEAKPGESVNQSVVLNGAQITALKGVVVDVGTGAISYASALAMLTATFGLSDQAAKAILGSPADAGKNAPEKVTPPRQISPRERKRLNAAAYQRRRKRAPKVLVAGMDPQKGWQRVLRIERELVPEMAERQLALFILIAKRVLERFEKEADPTRAHGDVPAIDVNALFIEGEFNDLFGRLIEPYRREVAGKEGQWMTDQLWQDRPDLMSGKNSGSDFVFSERVEAELIDHGARHVTNVDSTTKGLIADALVAGQAAGDSIDQQAKRLEAVIANPKRAMTIARTEVGAASQMAQLESMTQSGVVDGKTWFSQLDGAVRDSHQISGQTVRIEQNFKLLSGRTARIPRDPNLPPEDRANCRCFVGHKFIDEDEEL